jgi:hypothetical protein
MSPVVHDTTRNACPVASARAGSPPP